MKNRKKKKLTLTTALGITALICVCLAHGAAQEKEAAGSDVEQSTELSSESEDREETAESSAQRPVIEGATDKKEETVYVIADASGEEKEVIVNDRLENLSGQETLNDKSDLSGIENVKGDETFSQDGGDVVWEADGNDIHYQGTSEKELPVSMHISYYLDGKEIQPEELAGKSGKVKIRCDYTNREVRSEKTEDGEEEVYVPFTVMTGLVFTDYCVSNVEVNSGKVITKDGMTIVVGAAFPGLRESLEIEQDEDSDLDLDVDIPDYVEVTMDADNFSMETAASLVMSDLFGGLDLDSVSGREEMQDAVEELMEGAQDLEDGSSELADGVVELYDKVPDLTDGIQELSDGVADYTDGVSSVESGVEELKDGSGQLASGTAELASGAGTLASGADTLKDGAKTLASGTKDMKKGVSGAKKGTKQLLNGYAGEQGAAAGAKALADGAKTLDAGLGLLSTSSAQLVSGLETVSQGLTQLQTRLAGNGGANQGELMQLKQALDQFLSMVGGTGEQLSIHNCRVAIQNDVEKLNAYFEERASTSGTSAKIYKPYQSRLVEKVAANTVAGTEEAGEADLLKASAATSKASAEAAVASASEKWEQAGSSADSAESGLAEAQSQRTSANEQAATAGELYQNAVNAYTPILAGIRSTLSTTGLSKYAGYVDDGQATAESVAGGYQSANESYEAAAGSYQSAAESYRSAAEGYQDSAEDYQAAIDSYEKTIADYEALIAWYEEQMPNAQLSDEQLSDEQVPDGQVSGEQASDEQVSGAQVSEGQMQDVQSEANGQTISLIAGSGENQTVTQEQVAQALRDLAVNAGKLSVIEEGSAEAQWPGLTASIKALEGTLFGDGQENPGSLNELAAAIGQLYQGIGSVETTDTTTLLGGARALSVGAADAKKGSSQLSQGADQLSSGIEKLYSGTAELDDGMTELSSGAKSLNSGAKSLSSGAKKVSDGADTLASGAGALVSGSAQLDQGVSSLQSGVSELNDNSPKLIDGAKELADGADELSDGVSELKDGAEELRDGMEELNEDGIKKLGEIILDDMDQLVDRLHLVQDAGNDYKSFSGISDEMDGDVKFIIKVDGISAE